MARSIGSRLFLIASSIIILLLCNAQDVQSRITFLRSSVEFTQRTLFCPGEALTLTCTSSGFGITWSSEPSLSMSGDQTTIFTFVHNDMAGTSFSYLRNYTSGTAFFVSGVLEDVVLGGDCNSTITFVPIPNDEGQYPTSFGLFNITCTTELNESLSNRTQYWRVSATPTPVPESNVTCTYYVSHKVVKIEIMGQTITQDDSVELSHYDVSINGMNTTAVSAQSENSNGLFYPVEEDNKLVIAQIVAVDVCSQQSDPTVIRCTTVSPLEIPTCAPTTTNGSAATMSCISASIIILAITSMFLKQILMC